MKMKEQSLNSTPKISIPDTSLVGLKKSEPEKKVTEESTKLPMPTGWRLLILPYKGKGKTEGGIYLPENVVEENTISTQVGYVLKVGDLAFKDKEKFPTGAWCEAGNWVMFARYAGSRFKIDGGEVRILNDDEVLAKILEPEDILHF